MYDVQDISRCSVCGMPITNEQNFVVMANDRGEQQRAHTACVDDEHSE
jgi:hypothetical protein